MASWNRQEPAFNPQDTLPIPGPVPPPASATVPAAPAKREEPRESEDLLLGAGVQFEGKLTFKGTVRIDAKFTGSIVTNDALIVGERAKIDAEISCGTVVVGGEVNGNIKAKTGVELHKSAKVRGDVETPSLAMEKGALLHGHLKMMPGESSTKP